MSKKQPPRVQFDFEPDSIPENIPPSLDDVPSLNMSIEDDYDTHELELPSIEKKEIIEDEIFQMPDNLAVRPTYLPPQRPAPEKPVRRKGVNKDGTQRKPMSEEHKQKLALAREKAKIALEEKKKVRAEEKALELQEKELLKKQKVKRVQKLKEEVESDCEAAPPSTKTPTIQQSNFTMEDIQKAQFNAIMSYEALRKARKEEKKKEQMLEKQREDMRRTIQQHTQPKRYQYRDGSNRWDQCY